VFRKDSRAMWNDCDCESTSTIKDRCAYNNITDLRSFKTHHPPQNMGTAATASCIPRAS